jgi:hypothetical protein
MAKTKQALETEASPEQGKGRHTVIAVYKGDLMNESVRIKMDAMMILSRFLAKVRPDAEVMEDSNSIVMMIPGEDGDPAWVDQHVTRYVSLIGSGYRTADIDRKAEEMYQRFVDAPGSDPEKVGAGLIVAHLDKYYLIQRSASVFRREC